MISFFQTVSVLLTSYVKMEFGNLQTPIGSPSLTVNVSYDKPRAIIKSWLTNDFFHQPYVRLHAKTVEIVFP